MASEAALMPIRVRRNGGVGRLPMPFVLGTLLVVDELPLSFSSMSSGASPFTVEVEVERLPSEFLRGPKWVSLNSISLSA